VHKETGEQYAMKIVSKADTSPSSMMAEIKVMSHLSHQNIVNFKEMFDT